MASKDVILEVDEVGLTTTNSPQDELMFQEIPHTHGASKTVQTHVFTNFPHQEDSDSDDKNELLENEIPKTQKSFFSFAYYQAFFDIDARQVLRRILGSFFPNPKGNYFQSNIRPKPDFYGPFWVSTTLIMSIAIAGNLVDYFSAFGSSREFKWKLDFHKVTIATIVIYTYWLVMPLLAFFFLRWRGNKDVHLSELVCLYGYSLSIYIPISVLCLIPVYWLQWLFVLIGTAVSGFVMICAIWPETRNDKKQVALVLATSVSLMHCILAIGFMLYFFSPNETLTPHPTNVTTPGTLHTPTASTTSASPATTKALPSAANTTLSN